MGGTRGRGRNGRAPGGGDADDGMALPAPADPRTVLEAVAANPLLQREQVVMADLIKHSIDELIQQPAVRQCAAQALSDILQGTGLSFAVLKGSLQPLTPLAVHPQPGEDAIVLPDDAWSDGRLIGCLAEISSASEVIEENVPPPPDVADALLNEFDKPLENDSLRTTLQQLITGMESLSPGHGFKNTLHQLLNLSGAEGPLRLINGAPAQCDLNSFVSHLRSLEEVINLVASHIQEYLQSPSFKRSKYELFVLQHMQLLTWLQRVQTGLTQGVGKSGPEMITFVMQIAHAARVLLFQPLLLHALQVVHALVAVPSGAEEVLGSMRQAMAYPPEDATDADRVEWLQLNLLLQFQTVYKTALCQTAIYQDIYSPGEQQMLQGFLRLEEIYTHLIGRFPQCCPLSDQEQAVLSDLCRKLNKYFTDGKSIKQVLDQQPQQGKQLLVPRLGAGGTPRTVVREWILPFMLDFTNLLKVLWTLWTKFKREKAGTERQRVGIEALARQVGRIIVEQLSEDEAALRVATFRSESLPPSDLAVSRRAPGGLGGVLGEAGGVEAGSFAGLLNPLIGRAPVQAANGGYTQQAVQAQASAAATATAAAPAAPGDGGGSGWASIVRRPAAEPPVQSLPGDRPRPTAAVPPVAAAKPRTSTTASATDESIRSLVAKRETARFARDFESADKLREQLSRLGVTLDDQSKTWRMADGRSGPITAVNISELHAQKAAKSGAAQLSDDEIARQVKEREQARFTSDYKTADRIRDNLEKHGVHLDTKENRWQAADGRSGPIGPVNISAAHAQKAARSGVTKSMPIEEIEKILVQREQARARRDYKTADVLRDQLEKHGVYLDAKENKWHASDGRTGAIVMSSLSDDEVGKILAARQAARLRHDYKTADRLRDQLNEQCVSVDDKKNRWDASDGRSGAIEPYTCVHAAVPPEGAEAPEEEPVVVLPAPPAAATAPRADPPTAASNNTTTSKSESKRVLPEKARRELAKQLRAVTGASARLCEKALQSHADDMERAANWLLEQGEQKDVD